VKGREQGSGVRDLGECCKLPYWSLEPDSLDFGVFTVFCVVRNDVRMLIS